MQKTFSSKTFIRDFGFLLNETWENKKRINNCISNKVIDDIYNEAINAGAYGGKLLGAGAGGFMVFVVPKKAIKIVKERLYKLIQVPIQVDNYGTIINNDIKESDKQMLNRNILICGATGFIGKNMLEYFGRDKHNNIIAIYNRTPPFETSHLNAKIKWIKADLCSPSEVEKIMINVDYVIQAAATTSGAKDIISSPYIHVTDNAIMNSLLLREAFENKIKHFIFFSCTVMYQSSNDVVSESDYNPNVPIYEKYFGVGNTKIYIENMLEFFSNISNMKTTAIRHSNVYGPYDKFDFDKSHVFGATVSKVMMSDKKISVWGNGEEERDLLHVNDLCEFVNKVLKNQKKKNRIYNCGLGEKFL